MPVIRPFIIFLFVALLFAGCGGGTPGTTETPVPEANTAVPMATEPAPYPEPEVQEELSPTPTEEGYPAPESSNPEFTINRPVVVTDAQVTGTGPAGVAIELVNLTREGEPPIGQATINEDGTFAIDTNGLLIAKNEIGLILANTAMPDPSAETEGENRPGYQQTAAGILVARAIVQEGN